MISVYIVDQDPVRPGLRMRLDLEQDIEVVGEAGSGRDALSELPALAPDVVVMDAELLDLDGTETVARLHALVPHTAVIVVSIHAQSAARERAAQAGVAAFLEKHANADALVDTIRCLCAQRAPDTHCTQS